MVATIVVGEGGKALLAHFLHTHRCLAIADVARYVRITFVACSDRMKRVEILQVSAIVDHAMCTGALLMRAIRFGYRPPVIFRKVFFVLLYPLIAPSPQTDHVDY